MNGFESLSETDSESERHLTTDVMSSVSQHDVLAALSSPLREADDATPPSPPIDPPPLYIEIDYSTQPGPVKRSPALILSVYKEQVFAALSASPDEVSRLDIELDYSTQGSVENELNRQRLEQLRAFNHELLKLITDTEMEYGVDTDVDRFLRERMNQNAMAVKEWLNDLFIDNFSDIVITTALLRVIAHLEYSHIAPQGPTMALAALSHENLEVKECAIRAFENWGTADCLRALESVDCIAPWLQTYLSQVISDLRETLEDVPNSTQDRKSKMASE